MICSHSKSRLGWSGPQNSKFRTPGAKFRILEVISWAGPARKIQNRTHPRAFGERKCFFSQIVRNSFEFKMFCVK